VAKQVSIIVRPATLAAEYLSVSDAMEQVLDMVGALESFEASDEVQRRIIWRLTEAHTNSPPFTVVATAFPKDPQLSVAIEAERVSDLYGKGISLLLRGETPKGLERKAVSHLRHALERNLNGVGFTDVKIENEVAFSITPMAARLGLSALERLDPQKPIIDLRRSEFGSAECQVIGLTRYYNSPALVVQERLSGNRVVCVLSPALAAQIGPEHQWSEAWEDKHLRVSGELIYGADGALKRINASGYEEVIWPTVSLHDLREMDILQGRTVQEHLDEFWGEELG